MSLVDGHFLPIEPTANLAPAAPELDPIQQEIDNTTLAMRPEEPEPIATAQVPGPVEVTTTPPPKWQEIGTSVDGLAFSGGQPVAQDPVERKPDDTILATEASALKEPQEETLKRALPEPLEESKPEATAEKETPEPATFFFVYNEHSIASASAGMRQMCAAEVDVVAWETPRVKSEARREELDEILTQATASDATEEDIERAEAELEIDGIHRQMAMAELMGSDKQIALIDVAQDSSPYELSKRINIAARNMVYAVSEHRSNEDLRQAAEAFVGALAVANTARDNVMADQLEELSRKHPGKRIGVFVGAAHELLQKELEARGHSEIESVFIDGMGDVQTYLPPSHIKLAQDLEKNGLRKLTREELNRVVLEQTMQTQMRELGERSPLTYSGVVVNAMSDERVAELLDVMDEIKASGGTKSETRASVGALTLFVDQEHLERNGSAGSNRLMPSSWQVSNVSKNIGKGIADGNAR